MVFAQQSQDLTLQIQGSKSPLQLAPTQEVLDSGTSLPKLSGNFISELA
jgi:hypothetical protein